MTLLHRPRYRMIAFALIGLISFYLGWILSAKFNQDATRKLNKIAIQSDSQSSESKETELTTQPLPTPIEREVNRPLSADDLLGKILSESTNYQLTATRIIDYLALQLESEKTSILGEKKLRKLLKTVPEISFALLDQFAGIEHDRTKRQLGMHLMINNNSLTPFLEPKVIEKITLNEDRSQMLELIGAWGLQSISNINYFTDELPYMDKPIDASNAIRAITNSSWALNSKLIPTDKTRLTILMSEYRASKHDVIRAASVAALRSFPTEDYQQIVIDSFSDPSALVRQEAALLYLNNPFESGSAIDMLIEQLEDQRIDINQRANLAFQLGHIVVSDKQKKIIEDFKSKSRKAIEQTDE